MPALVSILCFESVTAASVGIAGSVRVAISPTDVHSGFFFAENPFSPFEQFFILTEEFNSAQAAG